MEGLASGLRAVIDVGVVAEGWGGKKAGEAISSDSTEACHTDGPFLSCTISLKRAMLW